MKILLTGVAGFVGWKTAQKLLELGHSIVGVDNLNDYYDPNLKFWRLSDLGIDFGVHSRSDRSEQLSALARESDFTKAWRGSLGDRLNFHYLDIESRTAVDELFQHYSFDAVINLAARAGVRASMDDPYVYFRTNSDGSVHLLEAMRRHGVGKYVLASTSSLYAGQPIPFSEDLPVNTPISPYAASKKAAEVAAYTWHHLYGIDVSICRYFTVYGPAGRPDMSPLRFLKWIDSGQPIQLYGDGSQRRDFTYIDDIASGTVLALKKVGFDIFNLGGGNEPIAINTMIAAFEKHLGKKAMINYLPFNKADMLETQADNRKARRILGWNPTTESRHGFELTAEWYCQEREAFELTDIS